MNAHRIGTGRARPAIAVGALLVVAVVAASCAGLRSVTQYPLPPGTQRPCGALAVRSCALPYPSDEFTVEDPTSATGRRLDVPDGLVEETVLAQLGPGASPDEAFAGADGYSALSPVVFEVDRPLAPLPPDGGNLAQAVDLTTGQPVPVRVVLTDVALRHGAPGTVVMVWPELRWEYGHSILVWLGRAPGVAGTPNPAPGLAGSSAWAVALRGDLSSRGVDPASLLSATRFTVGSRGDAVGELEQMVEITRAQRHPVRNLVVGPPLLVSDASAVVTGELAITDFRDSDGIVAVGNAHTTWIPFMLALPEEPASAKGAPVAVYGHGLTINKESMVVVAGVNAAAGVATIGIDVPNHGGRQAGEGGYLFDLANPRDLGRLVNMPTQGVIDHTALLSAVQQELVGLDLGPFSPDGAHGDGRVDLDPSTILYQGTSMGGVLGASVVALNPEIDAAYLQVAGSGVAQIIYNSLLWPLFMGVIPWNATAGDAGALLGAATMLLDDADNTHLLDGLRESGRPVFLQVGVGDNVVPGYTTQRMVTLLGLPLVGRSFGGLAATPAKGEGLPADGHGVAQIWPMNAAPDTQGFVAHVAFAEPAAVELLEQWVAQRLAAEGVTP